MLRGLNLASLAAAFALVGLMAWHATCGRLDRTPSIRPRSSMIEAHDRP